MASAVLRHSHRAAARLVVFDEAAALLLQRRAPQTMRVEQHMAGDADEGNIVIGAEADALRLLLVLNSAQELMPSSLRSAAWSCCGT